VGSLQFPVKIDKEERMRRDNVSPSLLEETSQKISLRVNLGYLSEASPAPQYFLWSTLQQE